MRSRKSKDIAEKERRAQPYYFLDSLCTRPRGLYTRLLDFPFDRRPDPRRFVRFHDVLDDALFDS